MGITQIYHCDKEGCGYKEKFGSGTDLRSLQKGGWLVIKPVMGGTKTYCPKCRTEFDEIEKKKNSKILLENLRHEEELEKIKLGSK